MSSGPTPRNKGWRQRFTAATAPGRRAEPEHRAESADRSNSRDAVGGRRAAPRRAATASKNGGARTQYAPSPPSFASPCASREARVEVRTRTPLYAALDLGTHNCRLLVARPEGHDFAVVDAFSRIVRLGEGLGASGCLSEAAIERTIAALSICAEKLVRRGVHLCRAVATEACRRARNSDSFIDRVYRETGIALDVISPEEEARLAVNGCHSLLETGPGEAMIFDIGGGSTELVRLGPGDPGGPPRILDWLSIPWGVVTLIESEAHDTHCPQARRAAYAAMRARPAEAIAEFVARIAHDNGPPRLLGTSGTVTTLGSLYLGLEVYDRKSVDGLMVDSAVLRGLCGDIADLSIAERASMRCIGPERADLMVAGCALLETVLDHWPAPRVGIADRGIREGILRDLIAKGHRK